MYPVRPEQSCRPTFEAGKDMRAFASSASSLSKTGEPRPFGQARITHVTSPPQESPLFRTSSITAPEKDLTPQHPCI